MGGRSKGATKFVVAVSYIKGVGNSYIYGCVPKPILERLGNPKRIRYVIKDDQILVSNADLRQGDRRNVM